MKVKFTPGAEADLRAIEAYIAEDDAHAADRVAIRIVQSAAILADFPKLGHLGVVAGTREFAVRRLPYLLVYAVSDEDVDILAIVHTRRQWGQIVG